MPAVKSVPYRAHPAPTRSAASASMAPLPMWMVRTPTLVSLKERALASKRMWEGLQATLPATLRDAVQAGKWADGIWVLTASSSAVAAKLKLLGPLMLRHVQQSGWPVVRITIRVKERRGDAVSNATAMDHSLQRTDAVPAPANVRLQLRALRARHTSAKT